MQKEHRNKLVKNLAVGSFALIICFVLVYWFVTSLPQFSAGKNTATTTTATTTTATTTTATATATTTLANFTIAVESNTTWSGNYTAPEEGFRAIGGFTNQTITFIGSACNVRVQKQTAEGFLRVKIYVNDVLEFEDETANPYGAITASVP
ncbi:MAG: hypothetical protein QXI91_03765 [Candidatus Bathyarchaeia archaeon]